MDGVRKIIDSQTSPVIKKLKDYVKIAKWNDITYWSVKQAIDKSHRNLLKYIKEYEVTSAFYDLKLFTCEIL